jgi:hypothetical protein
VKKPEELPTNTRQLVELAKHNQLQLSMNRVEEKPPHIIQKKPSQRPSRISIEKGVFV